MTRPAVMTIDLVALKHNLKRVREFAPYCAVMAMVKANAYGHGIVRVAEALAGVDAFGVASIEEGIKLREAGIGKQIVLLEGLFNPDELYEAKKYNFTFVVHHEPHVEILENSNLEGPFSIWLKIDTGMHRLGLIPDKIPKIYARLMQLQSIQKPIGLMTHFSEADDLKSLATQKQLFIFQEATAHLTGPRSLANSAAIIAHPQTHRDWVRPGIMLYGATPLPGKVGSDDGLKSVMTLSSRLIAINRVKKGDKVGYGGAWTADVDTLIGVVGIGYGDGYPQFALNGAPVLVNGMECPLAGRVSMDMLTVDLRHCPNAKINDPVILWGSGLPVERIAQFSQTSAYEILTRMTPRPKVDVLNG